MTADAVSPEADKTRRNSGDCSCDHLSTTESWIDSDYHDSILPPDFNRSYPGAFAVHGVGGSYRVARSPGMLTVDPPQPDSVVSLAWPVETDVVYEAQEITNEENPSVCWRRETSQPAPIPIAVKRILTSSQRRRLLPRDEEVQRVVENILKQDMESRNNGPADGDINAIDNIGENHLSQDAGRRNPSASTNALDAVRVSGNDAEYLTGHNHDIFLSSQAMSFLQGMGGLGKTTVAALAVAREDVRRHFHGGVAWVKIGQQKLGFTRNYDGVSSGVSYENYIRYCSAICLQLGVPLPHFNDIVFLPGDDAHIREEKTSQAMEHAHREMCLLLGERPVLIVLDDLWNLSDAELFCFATSHSSAFHILVTTRLYLNCSDAQEGSEQSAVEGYRLEGSIQNYRRVTKLGPLKEKEAIQLLFNEAYSLSSVELPGCSSEEHRQALSIVCNCQFLPVAIRSSARIINSVGLSKFAQEMTDRSEGSITNKDRALNDPLSFGMELYEILNLSFSPDRHGPIQSRVLKVCFIAFATVFFRPDCSRPWIPITTICMLWESIIDQTERSILQYKQGLSITHSLILEMETLGLIDSAVPKTQNDITSSSYQFKRVTQCRVHHDVLLQYARQAWKHDADLTYSKINHRFHQDNSSANMLMLETSLKEMKETFRKRNRSKSQEERLHRVLVERYEEKRNASLHLSWDLAVSDDSYVFHHIIYHMVQTRNDKICRKALVLLKNEDFISSRMKSLAVRKGVKKMMADVELVISWFQSRLRKSESESFIKGEALLVFDATRSILMNHERQSHSEAIIGSAGGCNDDIGLALVDVGSAMQGQDFWLQALDVFSAALDFFERKGKAVDDPLVMKTLAHVNASRLPQVVLVPLGSPKCIKFQNASQLRELTSGNADPSQDGISLELSSHPGQGVVLVRPQWGKMGTLKYHGLGIGSKESSIRLCAHDKFFWRKTDGARLTVLVGCKQGDMLLLTPSNLAPLQTTPCLFDFVVNDDGSISPCDDIGLALGIGDFPLVLVPRNSPNRLIFKYGKSLCDSGKKNSGHGTLERKGFSLELSSHPGCSVKFRTEWPFNIGPAALNLMTVGPMEDAVHASYDGRTIKSCKDGAVLRVMEEDGLLYNVGSPASFFLGRTKKMTCWKGGINDFIINKEGSISPMHARSLALGSACLSRANSIATQEEKGLADKEINLETNPRLLLHKYRKYQLSLGVVRFFDLSKLRENLT